MRLAASLLHLRQGVPKKRYNSFLFISKTPPFSLGARRQKEVLTRRKKRQGGREESNPPPATTASVVARSSPAGVSILLAILGFTSFNLCLQFKPVFQRRLRLKKFRTLAADFSALDRGPCRLQRSGACLLRPHRDFWCFPWR